jgi:hypothetical protein
MPTLHSPYQRPRSRRLSLPLWSGLDLIRRTFYAYQHTGMMVTEANLDQWSEQDLEEWDQAVARYTAAHGGDDDS